MGTTLCWAPHAPKEHGVLPGAFKRAVSQRYYDHDGSLGGGTVTIASPEDVAFLEGLVAVGDKDVSSAAQLLIDAIKKHGAVDIWLEA